MCVWLLLVARAARAATLLRSHAPPIHRNAVTNERALLGLGVPLGYVVRRFGVKFSYMRRGSVGHFLVIYCISRVMCARVGTGTSRTRHHCPHVYIRGRIAQIEVLNHSLLASLPISYSARGIASGRHASYRRARDVRNRTRAQNFVLSGVC